jgi:hypothetical protein
MAVVNRYETPTHPGEVAEAGIHPPKPTVALLKGSHQEHQDRDHERELMDVIRKTLK